MSENERITKSVSSAVHCVDDAVGVSRLLNDDLIADIIPIRITPEMSVAALYALETIFFLRLQLAQVAWEDDEPLYEELCLNRLTQIAKALRRKYKTAESLNEKIEILERLSAIGQLIHSDDADFAIEEADKLLRHLSPSSTSQSSQICCSVFRPGVGSYEGYQSQELRLSWIPNIDIQNAPQIASSLLNSIPNSSLLISNLDEAVFDMATIAIISDCVTTEEREAIFNRFTELFEAALRKSTDTPLQEGLGGLLALAAYWNSDPSLRQKLKELTGHITKLPPLGGQGASTILRLNPIAAEIYTRLDKITHKSTA